MNNNFCKNIDHTLVQIIRMANEDNQEILDKDSIKINQF